MYEVKISSKLIDELSLLYSDKFKAIGEVVINSIDSGATKVWIITQNPDEITVVDNGSGMTEHEIVNKYLLFGFSYKQLERMKDWKSSRPVVGSKGIAKVSGLSIANRMTISTWRGGKKNIFYLDREDYLKTEYISDYRIPCSESGMSGKELSPHGTEVKLSKLRLSHAINEKELIEYIAINLPVFYKDLEIRVNGIKVERTRIPYNEYLGINENHPILGKIHGEIFKARSKLTPHNGVTTRVHGIIIGKPHFFKSSMWQSVYGDFIGGEVDHVEVFEKNDEGLITAGRESFVESNPLYQEYEKFMKAKITGFLSELMSNKDVRQKIKKEKKWKQHLSRIEKFVMDYSKTCFKKTYYVDCKPDEDKLIECSFDSASNTILVNTEHPAYKYAESNKWLGYHIVRCALEQVALRNAKGLSDYVELKNKLMKAFSNVSMVEEERQKKEQQKKKPVKT